MHLRKVAISHHLMCQASVTSWGRNWLVDTRLLSLVVFLLQGVCLSCVPAYLIILSCLVSYNLATYERDTWSKEEASILQAHTRQLKHDMATMHSSALLSWPAVW